MSRTRLLPLILLLSGLPGSTPAAPDDPQSFDHRLARFFSPEVRAADRRLAEITDELKLLPDLYNGPRGSRFGFHSDIIPDQLEPHHLQIDLGAIVAIDSVLVMPVYLPTRGSAGEGYGFPHRFKIEISESQRQDDFKMVADHTGSDFKNPGRYPLLFPTPGVKGQFVRFTSTKHVRGERGCLWALEEVMVLSGNYNLAAARPRSASSQQDLFPNWSLLRVNDGLSRLGYPRNIEPSPTNGFLSAASKSATDGKWLTVDLEEALPIDEVRLIPTTSDEPEVVGGRGFPNDLVVELSNDPSFNETVWRSSRPKNPLGFPWSSALTLPCQGTEARYLRILASALFARGDRHSFALAEVQAYSGGTNVALHKPVAVSDRTSRADSDRWAPEFAVDGFSSAHRLAEWPGFIAGVVERGRLEAEGEALRTRRDKKIDLVSASVTAGAGSLGAVAVFGWLWMIVRQRTVRRRDSDRLREQIARDLHDDIGSNLGGIVLLSEVGSLHAESNAEIQQDFREIKETAETTADSMRDIVWLIQVGSAGLRELVIKMRESVEVILGDLCTSIDIEPPDFRSRPLTLFQRRHIFFAFKESLNNVRKHARAQNVSIRIMVAPKSFTFVVADDGVGFDFARSGESEPGLGLGLNNLKRRASRINGSCNIASAAGSGTTVTFTAPLKGKTS